MRLPVVNHFVECVANGLVGGHLPALVLRLGDGVGGERGAGLGDPAVEPLAVDSDWRDPGALAQRLGGAGEPMVLSASAAGGGDTSERFEALGDTVVIAESTNMRSAFVMNGSPISG